MIGRRTPRPFGLQGARRRTPIEDDGREMEAFGIAPENIPVIEKARSTWGIDDSGDASHREGSSDFLVTVAATDLSMDDFKALSRELGRAGTEFHYSELRRRDPVLCAEIMDGLSKRSVLFICCPRKKHRSDRSAGDGRGYFLESVRLLLEVIDEIDRSRKIIVEIDENGYMTQADCDELSVGRFDVKLRKSHESRWIQLADAGASSLGHSLVRPEDGDDFRRIRGRSVNMGPELEARLYGRNQHQNVALPPNDASEPHYFKTSEKKRKGKTMKDAESSNNLKKDRARRGLGRAG